MEEQITHNQAVALKNMIGSLLRLLLPNNMNEEKIQKIIKNLMNDNK
jgi:hypothetical protein